ncbi:Lrp/AsnC family transcriptional regulator [Burkholderia cepacia]|nr:Lrp/AsnC family transcriptional regulator [Burkholderia cepacia]
MRAREPSSGVKLDVLDLKIIRALQNDARLSSAELADKVALTASPCWRRVKQLEEAGVIAGYHAKISAERMGYAVKAFVFVSLERVDSTRLDEFQNVVRSLPEILSCHRVSGRFDYQMLVVAEDLGSFGAYAKDYINSLPHVKDVYTSFVLEEIKSEVAPPA